MSPVSGYHICLNVEDEYFFSHDLDMRTAAIKAAAYAAKYGLASGRVRECGMWYIRCERVVAHSPTWDDAGHVKSADDGDLVSETYTRFSPWGDQP